MKHSYHIFYFPFKWKIDGTDNLTFSEKVDMSKIHVNASSFWERCQRPDAEEEITLFNEKNYYYKFVHGALYDEKQNDDNKIIMHFERKECKWSNHEIYYLIKVAHRKEPYRLKVESMNINLYSTGVGFLSFYLANEEDNQADQEDILKINQYGRRVMPPFYADIAQRFELSEYIRIDGLCGDRPYVDTFDHYTPEDYWKEGYFITTLIKDLSDNISIEPIIDDRMFVVCWYTNDYLSQIFKDHAEAYKETKPELYHDFSDFWYRFVFVDGGSATCQNDEMKRQLLEKATYSRWQKFSSLYGCSRYSLVYLTNVSAQSECPYLFATFETIYARMVELTLMQRASILCFSSEVTQVSNLTNQEVGAISTRVSSLYKEYIRFINQIYFRSVTAQDQGVELYALLQSNLNLMEHIKDLDGEIQELFNYISLKEERVQNDKSTFLNDIATLFLPATIITGFFGMNRLYEVVTNEGFDIQVWLLIIGFVIAICIIYKRKRKL